MLRRLLTRAIFRQALAASEAWTPTDAPWTLPLGLAAVSSLLRPGSCSTSWLAASEIASPIVSGEMPSARASRNRLGGLLAGSRRRSSG